MPDSMPARGDAGWLTRARRRLRDELPAGLEVDDLEVVCTHSGCRVSGSGRLGGAAMEWHAVGGAPDATLDELIRHLRRAAA
jgi:hypothetical protein